jgi:hypothetical protein
LKWDHHASRINARAKISILLRQKKTGPKPGLAFNVKVKF